MEASGRRPLRISTISTRTNEGGVSEKKISPGTLFCNPIVPFSENYQLIQVPLMVGHNRDEGAMFLPQFLNHPERMQEVDDTFDVLGPVLLLAMDEQVHHIVRLSRR